MFWATLFLGLATGGLVVIAYSQMRQARASIQAARDSADAAKRASIATHRPRIVIRNVHIIRDFATASPIGRHRIGVSYDIVNTGDTAATVVGTIMSIDFLSGGFLQEIPHPRRGEYAMPGWDQFVLGAGVVVAQWYGNSEILFQEYHLQEYPAPHGIFFQGHILCEDDNRNLRHSSFCRRYNRERGYWPPTNYYDYEHTD